MGSRSRFQQQKSTNFDSDVAEMTCPGPRCDRYLRNDPDSTPSMAMVAAQVSAQHQQKHQHRTLQPQYAFAKVLWGGLGSVVGYIIDALVLGHALHRHHGNTIDRVLLAAEDLLAEPFAEFHSQYWKVRFAYFVARALPDDEDSWPEKERLRASAARCGHEGGMYASD